MLCKVRNSPYYYTNFTDPDGNRIRVSTKTTNRTLAHKYATTLYERRWRTTQLGEEEPKLWQEAVISWSIPRKTKKAWIHTQHHLTILDQKFRDLYVSEIKPELVDRLIQERRDAGMANATINRTLEVLGSVLRHCKKRGWVKEVIDLNLLDEPNARIRFITKEEANRLLNELPEHLELLARFSLATGLRESNVTRLRWDRVDLERRLMWIEGYELKNGEPFGVPLNRDAMAVLRRVQNAHPEWVFVYRRKVRGKEIVGPVSQTNTKAWRKALARAGIEDFRWHDLRHTWASWHVQNGTTLPVLQLLGGWKSIEMVMRYAHLAESHVAQYADNASLLHVVGDKKMAKSLEDSAEALVST